MASSGTDRVETVSVVRDHSRPVALSGALLAALAAHPALLGRTGRADVLDIGGGSGTLALALGSHGHRVRVVDPSPDAIAAVARRAAEQGLADRVTGVVGDVASLGSQANRVGLVCLHDVLEYVSDRQAALAAVRAVAVRGGLLSVVVPQRGAAVLGRALAGHPAQALVALHAADGRWGPSDPAPWRFDRGELVALVTAAGFAVESVRGERVVSELVPGALLDADPGTRRAYRALEDELAGDPDFAAVAGRLHVLAVAV